MDYHNAVLDGATTRVIRQLQIVMNTTAHTADLTGTGNRSGVVDYVFKNVGYIDADM